MSNTAALLKQFIDEQPVFSTHQHHLPRESQQELTLDLIFKRSYVGWCSLPKGSSKEERQDWLQSIRLNAYFVWLEKVLKSTYGIDRITANNWDAVSATINKRHQNTNFHLDVLKEKGKYIGFMEDSYWDPGSDIGYPDFITPVYRIDMWMQGFHPENPDHDGCNPHSFYGEMPTLDDYINRLKEEITNRSDQIVGLKCAAAYERTIRFDEASHAQAQAIFGKQPSEISTEEKKVFGDYIFHVVATLAEELALPIQIHTGLAQLEGSNPMNLESVIARFPRVQFVLFHGGFPWVYETAGLAHNYHNVILDINWLPLISTTAAKQALNIYMEVLRDNQRITWGADAWTSEEAVGASLAIRQILTDVLTNKMEEGYLDLNDAKDFAKKMLYRNAEKIYNLQLNNSAKTL